ncbi:hypothetical protein B7H23_04620 [Notoacmeibacter marinus]|uniref:2-hydroxychromene-2-carboxylate isomerase n=1 Tax=Notoacmeibacter marinus TaxID=1876515 RepID=A0A231V1X7_9HYPH|nr:2-hydroxychromene-2-carboxylate isomerase [Notoacmeibacter marinus]OXT02205.1 hypothetical protein B7H23_04620 [Notoacmeibacter marinus]
MTRVQSKARIEHYYWIISDWAYLGSKRLNALAAKYRLEVDHYPVRLLDVYAKTGGIPLPDRSIERQTYRFEEMRRWRDRLNMPLVLEPTGFPPNDELASCLVYAHKSRGGDVGELSAGIMAALWAESRDISDPAVLSDICREHELDGDALLDLARDRSIIAELDQKTADAIGKGVFGSPFYIYRGHRFWGQDRLDFLEELAAKDG